MGGYSRCRMLQTLVDYGRERLVESGDAARVRGRARRATTRTLPDAATRPCGVNGNGAGFEPSQPIWATCASCSTRPWRRTTRRPHSPSRAPSDGSGGSLGERPRVLAGSRSRTAATRRRTKPRGHDSLPGPSSRVLRDMCSGPARTPASRRPRMRRAVTLPGSPRRRSCGTAGTVPWTSSSAWRWRSPSRSRPGATTLAARAVDRRRADPARSRSGAVGSALLAFVVGRRAFVENRFADAEAAFRSSVIQFEALGSEVYLSFAYRYLGRLCALRADHDASIEAIESALHLAGARPVRVRQRPSDRSRRGRRGRG